MTVLMVMSPKTSRETKAIGAAELKAKCLELMDGVAKTGIPLTITKRGRPLAKLVRIEEKKPEVFGFAKGMVAWMGDVLTPVSEPWSPPGDDPTLFELSSKRGRRVRK